MKSEFIKFPSRDYLLRLIFHYIHQSNRIKVEQASLMIYFMSISEYNQTSDIHDSQWAR